MRILAGLVVLALLGLGVDAQGPGQKSAHTTDKPFARDGTPAQADLPLELHMKNTGGSDGPRGPGSGSGLCVMTSAEHCARRHAVHALYGFQKWMTRHPGGGWPAKLDAMIERYCNETKTPKPAYVQIESNDLTPLRAALRSGRMVGVTYSRSPTGRYGGATIAHMVNCVAAGAGDGPDGKGWYAVLDNNYPRSYEWMSEAEFLRTYSGGRRGWMFCLMAPAPPPPPKH